MVRQAHHERVLQLYPQLFKSLCIAIAVGGIKVKIKEEDKNTLNEIMPEFNTVPEYKGTIHENRVMKPKGKFEQYRIDFITRDHIHLIEAIFNMLKIVIESMWF